MPAAHAETAGEEATTSGRDDRELTRLGDERGLVGMAGANDRETGSNLAPIFHLIEDG